MSSALFYTAGIAFASGIFIRSFFVFGGAEIISLLVLSFVSALFWRLRSGSSNSPLLIMSIAVLCFALGAQRMHTKEVTISALAAFEGEEVQRTGVIVREPDIRERTTHLYVQLDLSGETILVTTDRYLTFAYGDAVEVKGEVSLPLEFETDLGRTFNYPGYLKARGVTHMVSFAEVTVREKDKGNPFLAALFERKAAFMETIEGILPEPEAGLSEGILLGVKRAIGEDLESVMRRAGIIHIVVLSGYNIMLVAEAIMRLLSFIFFPRTRMLLGIIGISIFALLVGFSATVIRASIMATLILVARATGRIYDIMRALMLAGVMMLIMNPYLLAFDPGFQLSFLATLGLIFLAPHIEARLHLVPTAFQIREFLTATIATQLFVLPLLLYLMGEFSVISVMVNVLVLPMVPFSMLFTFLAGSLGTFTGILGTFFGFGAYLSLAYILAIAEFFAALPFAALTVPAFPFYVVIVLYVLGAIALRMLTRETEKDAGEDEGADEFDSWTIVEESEAERAVPESPFPFR